VQLTIDDGEATSKLMDMLLAKKRASDRRNWLEEKGDLASLEVWPQGAALPHIIPREPRWR